MKLIKSEETKVEKDCDKCKIFEYDFEDDDIDIGVATITGRFPSEGYFVNTISKELIYVLEGEGSIGFGDKKIDFKKDDAILIQPNEEYYWETNYCKVSMSCSPAWSIELKSHKK